MSTFYGINDLRDDIENINLSGSDSESTTEATLAGSRRSSRAEGPQWTYEMLPNGEQHLQQTPPRFRVNFPPDTLDRRQSKIGLQSRRNRSMSTWSEMSRSSWRLDERYLIIIFILSLFLFHFG